MAMQAGTNGATEASPMVEMNTTPLIDVMLVLLIMFIITIPVQTHAVKLDLPGDTPPTDFVLEPDRNKVIVTSDDTILWNGAPTDLKGLERILFVMTQAPVQAELHLQPEPDARYERVDEVLAMVKTAEVQKLGFVGNEAYAAAF